MGKLRACSAVAMLALAACGSDSKTPDAAIIIIDAPTPDAETFFDAPPPNYDLSCLNGTPPTTAEDPVTIAGTTTTLSNSGTPSPVGDVAVDVFVIGETDPVASVTSNSSGAFTTPSIATGAEPLAGYIRAGKAAHRTTYLYPPTLITASLTGVPVPLVSNAQFVQIDMFLNQDDNVNGLLLVIVTDCSAGLTPVAGASLAVKQDNSDVGQVLDVGQFIPEAAGTFFVANVPDGEAQVTVTYNGTAWPTRTVHAYARGKSAEATTTVVPVRPGP